MTSNYVQYPFYMLIKDTLPHQMEESPKKWENLPNAANSSESLRIALVRIYSLYKILEELGSIQLQSSNAPVV